MKAKRSVELVSFEGKDVGIEEDKEGRGRGKGFAGLSSLISNVDETIAVAAQASRRAATEETTPRRQTVEQKITQATSNSNSGRRWSSAARIPVIIASVFGVLWLIGHLASEPNSRPPSARSSPKSPPSIVVPGTTPDRPLLSQAPARPPEERPKEGTNLILTVAQIRYCFAEDIRIEAARKYIDKSSESHIDRFNQMTADYNSRCAKFRYRENSLGTARREVESSRSQLQAEGRSRFASEVSEGSHSSTVTSPSISESSIRAIQSKLNTLGYDVGPVDGILGSGTRSAITRFEWNEGLARGSEAGNTLISALNGGIVRRWITQANSAKLEGASANLVDARLKELIESLGQTYNPKSINLQTCASGQFQSLCEHSLLTSEEAAKVSESERRANAAR